MRIRLLLLSIVIVGCAKSGQQPATGDGDAEGLPPTGDTIETTDRSTSPDSDQGSCPFQITEYPPSGKARLLAAYKICPSCHADLGEYLYMDQGSVAAYLYEDGLFLYRSGPEQMVPGFLRKTLTEAEACALLDGVDLAGLAEEAGEPWRIMYREVVDAWKTVIYLRNHGVQLEVKLNGNVHEDDFGLTPESAARAANSVALALNLAAHADGGAPYAADSVGLWTTRAEEPGMSCPSDAEVPEWPFPDIPLAEFQDLEFPDRTVPRVFEGEAAQELRTWAVGMGEETGCWRPLAVKEGETWRIILIDLPPDGYEGHPVSPCWTTGC
jgi:hypothetical protein